MEGNFLKYIFSFRNNTRTSVERVFFEHPAISVGEHQVEQEVESERSEEQEGRYETPNLQLDQF